MISQETSSRACRSDSNQYDCQDPWLLRVRICVDSDLTGPALSDHLPSCAQVIIIINDNIIPIAKDCEEDL